MLNGNDCTGCHMPKSGAVDIPHVSIHDHYIRKENLDAGKQLPLDEIEKIQQFVQLKCYTIDTPNAMLKAKAFLAFYEKFSSKKVYLDSALLYLNQVSAQENVFDSKVHYYFLQNNFSAIIQLHKQHNKPVSDSWTLYRIGEAYYNNSDFVSSISLFEKAVTASPYNLDFLNKMAATYFNLWKYS
jgi:tetratricopeptide (TPR) repeat protein